MNAFEVALSERRREARSSPVERKLPLSPRAEREESRRRGRATRGAGGRLDVRGPALTKITLCNKNDSKFPAADGGSDGGALDNGASLSPSGPASRALSQPATPIFRFKVPPCAPERNLANFYYLRLILRRRRVSRPSPGRPIAPPRPEARVRARLSSFFSHRQPRAPYYTRSPALIKGS